jgi:phosphate uptake regulator
MHIRKLVKAGPSSHTIALPKEWLVKNQLGKGSLLYITERGGELAISSDAKSAPTETREKTIEIDQKDLDTIGRDITSAYVNNYGTITLTGESLPEKSKDIRKLLHDFVALEIMEQTSKRLVARDLLNLSEVSVDKTLRRMDMILRSMLQDSVAGLDNTKLYDGVALRDYDMNRLYFLLYRLLKGSLRSPKMAQELQIAPHDALAHWALVNNLENLGDAVKNACSLCKQLKAEQRTDLKEAYSRIEALYLDVMKAQFTNDRALADSVARRRAETVEHATSFLGRNPSPNTAEIADTLKIMATLIASIARGVIDRE